MGLSRTFSERRLGHYGTSIFSEMSALAEQTGSVNLGQGFPDVGGPGWLIEAAAEAMRAGHNQYPPVPGLPSLRTAIARHHQRFYGIEIDPHSQVLVTAGASEGVAACLLAFVSPGTGVAMLEPFYDAYAAGVNLAGGEVVPVRLASPGYAFDPDSLRAAVSPTTETLLLNTPHNPTGTVLSAADLLAIAEIAVEHDLLVIVDEVYEHLVYDDRRHLPISRIPGMAERTLSIGSAGKSFAMTGWKVGWVTGPAALVAAVRTVKQFLSFASGTPFQHAIAEGLDAGDDHFDLLRDGLSRRRDQLSEGLARAGLPVNTPQAGYFLIADISGVSDLADREFCYALAKQCGVVAIPNSVFYSGPNVVTSEVRFAFCKQEKVLSEAIARMVDGVPRAPWPARSDSGRGARAGTMGSAG